MRTIAVYTNNAYFLQKIRLDAPSDVQVTDALRETALYVPTLKIVDVDTAESVEGAITASRGGEADIKIPFPIGTVGKMLERTEREIPILSLIAEERAVLLYGERIRLTDVEYSLLSVLYFSKEDFISREELLSTVWGEGVDGGTLNVYVHYLREKLETKGEKIILSSRKSGYGIDKKFKGRREEQC